MRDRLPSLTALLLLIILVIGTWWAAYYTHSTVELDPPRRQTHEPDSWAKHFIMLRSNENGFAINRLEGAYMEHFPDDDSYHIDKAHVTLSQENNPVTTGTADVAIMDQGGDRIQMIGHAYIHRQPDEKGDVFTISSEQLTLLPQKDSIQTQSPAVVVNGAHTLKGKGMYYDNTTRQLQVYQNTHVIMSPSHSTNVNAPAQWKNCSYLRFIYV